jgi:hypothetical protein
LSTTRRFEQRSFRETNVRGLDRVVDPEVAGREEAAAQLRIGFDVLDR